MSLRKGYLRPHWITYERGGANGHSRLMTLSVARMAAASRVAACDVEPAPPIWGAAWRHAAHGVRHHSDIGFRNRAHPHFEPHRPTGAARELGFYLRGLPVPPLLGRERLYHRVLLQMAGGFRAARAWALRLRDGFRRACARSPCGGRALRSFERVQDPSVRRRKGAAGGGVAGCGSGSGDGWCFSTEGGSARCWTGRAPPSRSI